MTTDLGTIEILDRVAVLDRIEGDMDLYRDLLGIFKQEYPIYLHSVSEALALKDADKLMRSAHAFKSALGNLGAMRCFSLIFALELQGRNKELSESQTLLDKLREQLDLFLEEADKFAATK